MFLKHIDLTTALRPSYLPDEVLLFVQDNVGLYEGKFKIPDHQNGQVYLTSHRICYIDNASPRMNSTAIDLKDVERYEFYGGFLKSSPKITLVPKPLTQTPARNRAVSNLNAPSRKLTASPACTESSFHLPAPEALPASSATWICTICSFSNLVPSNFDPYSANERTPLAPCLACGIKPAYALVMRAAISAATSRPAPPPVKVPIPVSGRTDVPQLQPGTWPARPESPGPMLHPISHPVSEINESFKLSFRGGGGPVFYERLKGSMQQRKWLLQGAPPVPTAAERTSSGAGNPNPTGERVKTVGIAGLEQRRLEMRKNNELVIGNAFEDLEALMASAKEIVALAESFSSSNGMAGAESNAVANALGLVTTKDMLGGGSNSESLYISELSRNLAEFLTDDARGVLRKAGGIISLVDLWALFNRARGGVELVSPLDFEKAARQWEKLKLPVRLRQFKSGVLVVQGSDRTDEKTIKTLLAWLNDLHIFPPDKEVEWEWKVFGRSVTAQDAAQRFGWSIGVAEEELEMAEERGALCREEGIEGLKFWENWINDEQSPNCDALGVV
ncbi:vacuolar protein-sorting-associated protein [Diplocarpon mali]|nr:vacuolar protein-sorting-associated protein [Diplocarpon mali]